MLSDHEGSDIEAQGGCQSGGQEWREGGAGCSCCSWVHASWLCAPVVLGELWRWHGGHSSVFFVAVICAMIEFIICACVGGSGGVLWCCQQWCQLMWVTSEVEALLKIVHLPYYYNPVQTKIINSHLTKLIW